MKTKTTNTNNDTLLGSSTLPAEIEIAEGMTVPLGTVVEAAHKDSGLSVDDWNALPDDDREKRLAGKVNRMIAEAAVDAIDEKKNNDKGGNKKGGNKKAGTRLGMLVRTRLPRRCRAGLRFGQDPKFVAYSELKKDQVDAIKGDPHLIVQEDVEQ